MRQSSSRSRRGAGAALLMGAVGLAALGRATLVQASEPNSDAPTATNAKPAVADAPDATQVETVVVTGSRKPVTPPREIKRDTPNLVDAVTANELERIPDQSLAEALDRVVGVSSDVGYNSSQARTVTIRGFDARYDSMDVDGNPIWNASRNNRGTQLDIFPATAVSQVDVYKVVDPDQDANSIGGHIELRTLRAFDGGTQPYLSMRAEAGGYANGGGYETTGSTPSYLVSAVGKRTFGPENRFGVVVGADLQQDAFYDNYATIGGYSQLNGVDVVNGDIYNGKYFETVTRSAVYAKLEARATDRLYAFLFASGFRERNDESIYRAGPFLTATQVTSPAEVSGAFSKTPEESYLETYNLDRKSALIGSGLDYRLGARSTFSLRASYTNYDHHELDENSEKFEGPTVTGTYAMGGDGPDVVLAPSAAAANPANWAYRNKNASTLTNLPDNDNVYSIKADYKFNDFADSRGFGFEGGVFFRRLNREFNETYTSLTLPKGVSTNLAAFLPAGATVSGASPAIANQQAFWSYIERNGVASVNPEQTADYHLVEDVYAGYADVTFRTQKMRALLGVRVEDTQSTDQTGAVVNNLITPETYDIHYLNALPNAQVTYDVLSNLRLRAAYTETIARPDFSDFAMGQTITYDVNGYPVISGTNHDLKPRESNNVDLDLEYYFNQGYVSLALFHKSLHHEEFKEETQQTNASGIVVLTETVPLNSGSGRLSGLEFSLAQDRFWWLPHPFDGLYANLNYTRLDGVWDVRFTNGTSRSVDGLRNQPHWLGNLTAGYRIGRLDVSTSVRWRGQTFTGTFGTTAAGDVWYSDYTRVDAHASYNLTRHISLFVEGRNLNDATLRQTTGLSNALYSAVDPGPSGFIGVKFKN